jgi:hypothetical protein
MVEVVHSSVRSDSTPIHTGLPSNAINAICLTSLLNQGSLVPTKKRWRDKSTLAGGNKRSGLQTQLDRPSLKSWWGDAVEKEIFATDREGSDVGSDARLPGSTPLHIVQDIWQCEKQERRTMCNISLGLEIACSEPWKVRAVGVHTSTIVSDRHAGVDQGLGF